MILKPIMTSEEKIQRRKMSMDGLIPYYVQHQSGEAVVSMQGRKREATSYCGRSCVAGDKEQWIGGRRCSKRGREVASSGRPPLPLDRWP